MFWEWWKKNTNDNNLSYYNQISALLPHNFDSAAGKPKRLVCSSIVLVRPLDSPQSPPWMVLLVKPTKGVTQLFNPFTRTQVENVPSNFDLTKFHVTHLGTECHIVDDDRYGLFCGSSFYTKALVFFQPSGPFVHQCHLFAAFNDGQVWESQRFDHRYSYFQKTFNRNKWDLVDMISSKGKIYPLDKTEQLFLLCKQRFCLCFGDSYFCSNCQSVVRSSAFRTGSIRRRLRLAVSSSSETLYMVSPITFQRKSGKIKWYFRVCELNLSSKSWCQVSSFKDAGVDQVLFITRDYCFFAAASEFPGCQFKNCIVFAKDAFPLYKRGWAYATKDVNGVAIFSLDKKDEYSMPVELHPSLPVILCTPPHWVIPNASSPSQSKWKSISQR